MSISYLKPTKEEYRPTKDVNVQITNPKKLFSDMQHIVITNDDNVANRFVLCYSIKGNQHLLVFILVKNVQTDLIVEIYFKSLVRATGKV